MKWILISMILFCVSFVHADRYESLFSLAWGDAENEIGLSKISLGGVSHEEGYFSLRYGPQAIAVQDDKVIFILDKIHDRILSFDREGKLLQSYAVAGSVLGLAVSKEGTLVAFSPSEKYALGITGNLAGKRMEAPEVFGALSEVWFEGQELWGRYHEYVVRLDEESRLVIPFVHASCVNEKQFTVGIEGDRDSTKTLEVEGHLCDAYALGSILNGQRLCVTLVRPLSERARQQELVLCEANGEIVASLPLTPAWTDVFCSYAVTKSGNVYELVVEEKGVSVRCWKTPAARKETETKVEATLPLRLPPTTTTSRTTVNVWFRGSNVVKTMDVEEYLKGVVSQEIYASWHVTAHKAMAVAARTYALARYRHPEKSPKAHVCDSTCCQAWTSNHNSNAITGVNATAGEFVMRNGSRITEPLYFSHCNGHTRNSEDYDSWNSIAYLRSQSCICGYTSYFGHGVGMCQYGMQAYATKNGFNYNQIISHYYKGCTVGK